MPTFEITNYLHFWPVGAVVKAIPTVPVTERKRTTDPILRVVFIEKIIETVLVYRD
jgi:hypothetical protein